MSGLKGNFRVRAGKIKLRWIENYQSANCWYLYGSNKFHEQKLYRMAMLMAALGMHTKNIDETAFAEAAALALWKHGGFDPQYYLAATRQLKVLSTLRLQKLQ